MTAEFKAFVFSKSFFPLAFILPLVNIFLLPDNGVWDAAPTANSLLIVAILSLLNQCEAKREIRSQNVLADLHF